MTTENDKKQTILAVDDTPENLDVVKSILVPQYMVKAAVSGKMALKIAEAQPPDLILLDIMMPEMDGYEVCRLLKGNPATAKIPVIFLTAKDETEDETKGLELGAVDYILKPVSPPILEARVKTHLTLMGSMERLRRARREVEKRNRFIRQTFGRYLSDDIVESILETPEGLDLGGEERKVTILMSDIRGFSSLAQRLPPENVISMLNIYLEAMTDIILKHKGTIDEFIGDAILVIFGAPLAYGSDSKRAVACAVEMQLAMEEVNARFREAGFPEIGMGVGLRTGEVVVGNIGSSKRSKYGVVGHNVNLASRIEAYTVAGQILACERTLEECGATLRIDGEMEVAPKGVDQPITISEIGGIGGDYNVFLPEMRELELEELDDPLLAEFSVLAGKDAGTVVHPCEVMAVSSSGARLQSAELLPELRENLKLTLRGRSGTPLSDAIYAKVWEHTSKNPGTFIAYFTSVPPATGSFLETVIAKNRQR